MKDKGKLHAKAAHPSTAPSRPGPKSVARGVELKFLDQLRAPPPQPPGQDLCLQREEWRVISPSSCAPPRRPSPKVGGERRREQTNTNQHVPMFQQQSSSGGFPQQQKVLLRCRSRWASWPGGEQRVSGHFFPCLSFLVLFSCERQAQSATNTQDGDGAEHS